MDNDDTRHTDSFQQGFIFFTLCEGHSAVTDTFLAARFRDIYKVTRTAYMPGG